MAAHSLLKSNWPLLLLPSSAKWIMALPMEEDSRRVSFSGEKSEPYLKILNMRVLEATIEDCLNVTNQQHSEYEGLHYPFLNIIILIIIVWTPQCMQSCYHSQLQLIIFMGNFTWGIGSDKFIEQSLDDRFQLLRGDLSVGDLAIDPAHDLLLGPGLPNTVTSHDDEPSHIGYFLLVLRGQLHFLNFGKSDDQLFLGLQLLVLFVLKVSQGPGQVEVAVDTSITDEATSLLDTVLLLDEVRFVVLTQEVGLAASSQNGSRVTSVGDVQCVLVKQCHVCCAPGECL